MRKPMRRLMASGLIASAGTVVAQAPSVLPLPGAMPEPKPLVAPALPPTGSPYEAVPKPVLPAAAATGAPAPSPSPAYTTIATMQGPAMLSVKQTLPESISPGQPVQAEVTVANNGGKSADGVVLSGWWTTGYELNDASTFNQATKGKFAWTLGTLAPGESRTLKFKFVPQSGTQASEFRSGFDATFNSASDTRTIKVTKPELQLALEAPPMAFVGQPVQVLLKIKNPTAAAISNVTIRTLLPEVVSHAKGNDLENELASIPAGGTEIIPLTITAMKSGEGRVRVRIGGAGCDAIEQEVKIAATEARLAVAIGGPKAIYKDWPATFEATVENQGDQTIKNASFEVKLPAGLSDLRASDTPGYDATTHRIVWKFDQLKPGEKKTVLWFGIAKTADDLTTTGTLGVGGLPLKRGECATKNLGAESK